MQSKGPFAQPYCLSLIRFIINRLWKKPLTFPTDLPHLSDSTVLFFAMEWDWTNREASPTGSRAISQGITANLRLLFSLKDTSK